MNGLIRFRHVADMKHDEILLCSEPTGNRLLND